MQRTKIFIFLCGVLIGILGYSGYLYFADMMAKPDLERNWEKVHVGMHADKVKKLIGNPEFMASSNQIFADTVMWSYADKKVLFFLGNEVAVKKEFPE